jgi:DNA invertase Pin-like site-specific DNA recombinase
MKRVRAANVFELGRLTLNVLLSFAQFEREVIGESASSAAAISRFRESIPHPIRPLSMLRTPRCRDARKTRSRPAC